ncbi:HK97 family phage prohead protease [Streptomyces sp. V2]|uniref:HK97 family phage prohead protease n=1 Tax=Streptomyces sp. V2 TaxID=1424099 RepID=UPI000D6711B3|nr:HK97 family phage prohead protease [Streptomyces sp. V2]PWG13898.1 HK97 family phage prohead protease [Streptomyces sp. V2]
MRTKSCPVRIKAAGTHEGTDEGVFEAIVAAYNVDSVSDKITPGAFAETLAEWKGRGDPIPVLWSHMSHDPDYHIGEVLEAEERPEGLWVKARIDLDASKAAQVYRLLKGRRVTQFSFAYDIEEGSWVERKDGPGYYELRKLTLYEVGPTLIGANQATELIDVKSATVSETLPDLSKAREALESLKAGRTLSAQNEQRVRDIGRLASELLESLPSSTDEPQDAEKATPAPPAVASLQDTPEAKAVQPAGPSPASLRLHADLEAFVAEVSTLTD